MREIIRRIKQKFIYAFVGIWISLKEEKSLWVHIIISTGVITLGIICHISNIEWAIIVLTITLVIAFEIINTSIEAMVDTISFQFNIKVKRIKDIAAAATLVTAIAAIVVAILIFVPKI